MFVEQNFNRMSTGVNARLNNTFGTNNAGIMDWLDMGRVGRGMSDVGDIATRGVARGQGAGSIGRDMGITAAGNALSYFGGGGFTGKAQGMASAARIGTGLAGAGMAGHMLFGNFSFMGAGAGAFAGGAIGGPAGMAIGGLAGGEIFG